MQQLHSITYHVFLKLSQIVMAENKMYAGFLLKANMALGDAKKSIIESTVQIKEDSENATLLFYQAKGLMQLNMNEQALTAAKYACEMCPESTSAWVLLAHCYFLTGNFEKVSRPLGSEKHEKIRLC